MGGFDEITEGEYPKKLVGETAKNFERVEGVTY